MRMTYIIEENAQYVSTKRLPHTREDVWQPARDFKQQPREVWTLSESVKERCPVVKCWLEKEDAKVSIEYATEEEAREALAQYIDDKVKSSEECIELLKLYQPNHKPHKPLRKEEFFFLRVARKESA